MKYFGFYITRWVVFLLISATVLVLAISSMFLIKYLKKQEAQRIDAIATAMKFMQDDEINDPKTLELILAIVKDNHSIPVILTNQNKKPILAEGTYRNISKETIENPQKIQELINEMEQSYKPLLIKMPNGQNQYIFYSNSKFFDYLQYYPWFLGLFVGGYLLFSFWFFRTIKRTDENYLWAGLAKETAHQIGTPLSSMMGWIEILKMENKDNEGLTEMETDVKRLAVISERFSKIGSVPELNDLDLKETFIQNYDYLKARISSKINFKLIVPQQNILVPHSKILMGWVIENLVKNSVDAMKGEGSIEIVLCTKNDSVYIDVKDTGCGMTATQIRNVFKAGYSTKKRGWGLGLSLVKRAIEEYHNGEIKVLSSELGKGTIFRIIL